MAACKGRKALLVALSPAFHLLTFGGEGKGSSSQIEAYRATIALAAPRPSTAALTMPPA
jgi:hypothetical protein